MQARCITLIAILASISGCTAARKTGEVSAGANAWIAEAIISNIFDNDDDDETIFEREHRERNERKWKQAWRDNPNVNPAMTAAYKDDYQ